MFCADLHVHSRFSGRGHLRLPGIGSGLPDPEAIRRVARGRGLDLVTLTDTDTIEGCLRLLEPHGERSDVLISEEVSAADPRSGARLSVLLYGLTEAQHREAQRLKGDVRDLLAYARQAGIVASLGSFLDGPIARRSAVEAAREFLDLAGRLELKDGRLGRAHNEALSLLAHHAAGGRRYGVTAGSNAHTLARIGRTVTVSAARSRGEFLEDLRHHRTWAAGEDGGLRPILAEASSVLARGYAEAFAPRPARGSTGRAGARALLALPLHLAGWPLWSTALQAARLRLRVRRARRPLDRLEVSRFKEKARTYQHAILEADSGTGGAV